MDHMLRPPRRSVIGARDQPASTPGLSRGSTRAPMPARASAAYRWLRVQERALDAAVPRRGPRGPGRRVGAADGPEARAARPRPVVLVALVAFVVAARPSASIYRTRLRRPAAGCRLLAGDRRCCALVLAIVQPDGAGVLALYITLGDRLRAAGAAPRDPGLHGRHRRWRARCTSSSRADGTWARHRSSPTPARSSSSSWATCRRQFRLGQARAERLVEELEASREAQAQAIALRERGSTSRARCTTCSPTRSRRSPCSSRARGCSRAATGADPQRGRGRRAQPPPGQGRPRGGAARDRGAARRRHARARPAAARSPTQFREQTGVETALALDGEPRELPSEARLAVYRTAQEALTNVRRHADGRARSSCGSATPTTAPG